MQNRADFKDFINEHLGIIKRICNAYSQDREEYDDFFQEVTIQMWKSYSNFRGRSKISTWVYRVCLNVCITQRKKEDKFRFSTLSMEYDLPAEEEDSEQEYQLKNLNRAIKKLSDTDKAIILLFLEDKSYKEMAEVLGTTVSHAGVKLKRAKDQLKKHMSYGVE